MTLTKPVSRAVGNTYSVCPRLFVRRHRRKSRLFKDFFVLLFAILVVPACSSPPRAAKVGLTYEDFMNGRSAVYISHVSNDFNAEGTIPDLPETDLERFTKMFALRKAQIYEGGVYGKVGDVTVFAASPQKIPDFDRLYWVMIKVLSEKYGCFVTAKRAIHSKVEFRCRDTRWVVFRRSLAPEAIHFYARQYDQYGRELIVRNRQIVR